jgi:uncharacterized protein YndB with AHSA1/START domain
MIDGAFAWPPVESPGCRWPTIDTRIVIDRACERVFDYATTPALWSTWHPATLAVRDAPARPLAAGETMVEQIRALGLRFDARWTVLACERPALWAIATETPRGDARIVYRVSALDTGSLFRRTLQYRSRHWPWRTLDANLTRWLLARQSARALANLKHVVEGAA